MANDSILIHNERGARAEPALFIEDAVVFDHFAFEIAEQGESYADILGEAFVSG